MPEFKFTKLEVDGVYIIEPKVLEDGRGFFMESFKSSEFKKIGLLQICSYRPFPRKEIYNTLKDKMNIVVVEKSISLGRGGILASDVRWSFPRAEKKDRNISSFIAGLGGRNITKNDLRYMVEKVEKEPVELEFLGLKKELIAEKDL